jgi:hypothetical protein
MSTKILADIVRLVIALAIVTVVHSWIIPIISSHRDLQSTNRWCEPSEISRRKAIQFFGTKSWLVTGLAASVLVPRDANAAADQGSSVISVSEASEGTAPARPATSAAESIRRAASSIPGFGPSDVLFPGFMLGKWYLTRDIVTSTDPRLNGMLLPFTLKYEIRFIPSLETDYVVADRGFNQASLERALAKALRTSNNDPVQALAWTESNPNDLTLTMVDGSRIEMKVTKRSTEKSPDGLGISTSEFLRYTAENSKGIPNISARRVLTKWKVWNQTDVDGLELVYDMGVRTGDPLMLNPDADFPPRLISKARIHLDRFIESNEETA